MYSPSIIAKCIIGYWTNMFVSIFTGKRRTGMGLIWIVLIIHSQYIAYKAHLQFYAEFPENIAAFGTFFMFFLSTTSSILLVPILIFMIDYGSNKRRVEKTEKELIKHTPKILNEPGMAYIKIKSNNNIFMVLICPEAECDPVEISIYYVNEKDNGKRADMGDLIFNGLVNGTEGFIDVMNEIAKSNGFKYVDIWLNGPDEEPKRLMFEP